MSIQDTGIGMSEDEVEKIFDRFYQVDSSHTRKYEGAGIGLSLVQELVKLHRGTITVQSKPGIGTVFTIKLLLGRNHLLDNEIDSSLSNENSSKSPVTKKELSVNLHREPMVQTNVTTKDVQAPVILFVEDNTDMRHYLIRNFRQNFNFIEAENGITGFEKAVTMVPDLIVSDLMMPGMDGYELCRKIRGDDRTSHIPIIMLTAKAGKENLLTGYGCGVDDYLAKPFDHEILQARINNLLNERKLLREKFTRKWIDGSFENIPKSSDEKFIKKLNDILEKNYANPAFGTQFLLRECGMSHSVLFRKLKAVTNLSPNTYIRNFRLIKAYQLISQGDHDISSAAYSSGFNSMSYFSRCFKTLYKKLPHEIGAQNKV